MDGLVGFKTDQEQYKFLPASSKTFGKALEMRALLPSDQCQVRNLSTTFVVLFFSFLFSGFLGGFDIVRHSWVVLA
jgi:hypothetical protein